MTAPITPSAAGFEPVGPGRYRRRPKAGTTSIEFRLLTALPDLRPLEELQRVVLGVSDLDVTPASLLKVVPETGGFVIGAYAGPAAVEPIGVSIAFGGHSTRGPRLVSDMLGVLPAWRSMGLGEELKRLQAVLALERGFPTIVWTADPLRAGNARLNFGKLGAYADRYERDRYGASFGEGLSGGMPSDRLHITWPIGDPEVQRRLRWRHQQARPSTLAGRPWEPGVTHEVVSVEIPPDIDALVATDLEAALAWRYRLRSALEGAFADGYAVVDFMTRDDAEGNRQAHLVLRRMSPDPPMAAKQEGEP